MVAWAERRGHPRLRRFGRRVWDGARLMRLNKPIGIFLLLWPLLWTLWMVSGGVPRLDVLVVFIEPHDWLMPGEGSSRSFQAAFGQRDFEIFVSGENIIYVRRE